MTFAPGETIKTVRIDIADDGVVEPLESFTFQLFNPSANASIARAVTRIGIADNDNQVQTPALYVRDATVDESAGTISVPVLMGGTAAGLQRHRDGALRDR